MTSDRHARQLRLPEIGAAGQERLASSRVAIVGLGALGSITADALCRAGVGKLRLIDRDVVEMSNLQRQSLYDLQDAERGELKAVAAARRLAAIDPGLELEAIPGELHAGNASTLLADCDLLLDGSDNFPTRYLLNDYAVRYGNSFVYAGVVATYGMSGAVTPAGPCLRCLWPEPPAPEQTETCTSAGVLGPAVAVIGGWSAALALRVLVEGSAPPDFTTLDPWHGRVHRMKAVRDPACPCCGDQDFPWLEGRRDAPTAEVACAGNAVRLPGSAVEDLAQVSRRLAGSVQDLQLHPAFLRFRFGPYEILLFAGGQRLVRGTDDPAKARSVLAETIGN